MGQFLLDYKNQPPPLKRKVGEKNNDISRGMGGKKYKQAVNFVRRN